MYVKHFKSDWLPHEVTFPCAKKSKRHNSIRVSAVQYARRQRIVVRSSWANGVVTLKFTRAAK